MLDLKRKLRNIEPIKNFYRGLRKFYLQVYDSINVIIYRLLGNNILLSHFARVNNFGDRFNIDLIDYFNYKLLYVNRYELSEASLTGSILHLYKSDYNGYILGSGFIKSNLSCLNNSWRIEILRGPLSAVQCGLDNVKLYGDPGLLASLIYPDKVEKKYKLGIVPHDIDLDLVKKMRWSDNIKIISVRNSPRKVTEQIKKCEYIASSSLHGLIFADAFKIPNVHLKFGDRLIGGNHKFIDYYLGINSNHHVLNFSNEMSADEIINGCKIHMSSEYLEMKQESIINVYRSILRKIERKRLDNSILYYLKNIYA